VEQQPDDDRSPLLLEHCTPETLARHLTLRAHPADLLETVSALGRLPAGFHTRFFVHQLDLLARGASGSLEAQADEAVDTILARLTPGPPSRGTWGRQEHADDLARLLDLSARHASDPARIVAALTALRSSPFGAWCSRETATKLAKHSDHAVLAAVASLAGANLHLYLETLDAGPQAPELQHLLHDEHGRQLARLTPEVSTRGHHGTQTASAVWHEHATRAGGGARRWDRDSLDRLAQVITTSWGPCDDATDQARRLGDWRARIVAACGDSSGAVSVSELIDVTADPGEGAGPGPVGPGQRWPDLAALRIETLDTVQNLLAADLDDADQALPVWVRLATLRPQGASSLPLALMSHTVREQVWSELWDAWAERSGKGAAKSWPAWCPWPDDRLLLRLPAAALLGGFPHAQPSSWVLRQLRTRLQRTDDLGDAYHQTLTLCGTWPGSVAQLLDASAAALQHPQREVVRDAADPTPTGPPAQR
jgi:hypothetical protein